MNRVAVAQELLKLAREFVGVEFPSQFAMDWYLKMHPGADKSLHWVKQPSTHFVLEKPVKNTLTHGVFWQKPAKGLSTHGVLKKKKVAVAQELAKIAKLLMADFEKPLVVADVDVAGDVVKGIPALVIKLGKPELAGMKSQPGMFTFRRGYFYHGGMDDKKMGARIVEDLEKKGFKATLIDSGDHWAAFKGSAKEYSSQSSFMWAVVQVERTTP